MNAVTPTLTPLALEHAVLLQRLQARDFPTKTALAQDLGRALPNLNKTLKVLETAGLVADGALTAAGANAVRVIARLEAGEDLAPAATGGGMPPGFALLLWAQIEPDPLNPRKHFDDESIEELADSIARDGLLENLVVRPGVISPNDGGGRLIGPDGEGLPMHRLVAGERRHRAMKRLIERGDWGVAVPIMCKVVEIDDAGHRRLALVENLQRKDLRPIDEATALKELMAVTGMGTAEVAAEIGFTQRFVQQRLQLLELPAEKQDLVNTGVWTIEQARQSIASTPKPVVLGTFALRMLAEIAVHSFGKGKPKPGKLVIVGGAARDDAELADLRKKGLVYAYPDYQSGQDQVQLLDKGWQSLLATDPEFADSPSHALGRIYKGQGLEHYAPDHGFMTPWLREPFELHPDELAKQRKELERVESQAAREAAAREAEEREVRLGARFLKRIRTLEAALASGTVPLAEGLKGALAAGGFEGPFVLGWDGNQLPITDAKGQVWLGGGPTLEALRRLMVIAINAAIGDAPASGPDLATPWAAECDETSSAEGDDPTDDEPSDALKRLAGVPTSAGAH